MSQQPWYRHRWPWILISVPVISVILGVVLLTIAFNNPAILVVDNYYSEGRAINQSLAMDDAATERGISANLQLSGDGFRVTLNGSDDAALRLFIYHATDPQRDQQFILLPDESNGFRPASAEEEAALDTLLRSNNIWYFEVRGETDLWRLRQRVESPTSEIEL
ncbi:FixH family protein [Pseudohongiella spirulinae]|uniref:Nitrogen fixation protein FixH n=1 Tax=Pseudohongiella spirulinae TaxID=1249552 RepID=A0A0S2KGP7_9GAMM|nr:FixH family protein [Pseudohongiella spirulinae]ALO47204.1 hypothetical protein PS2015_2571 [Pseudohongiella spirulinae]